MKTSIILTIAFASVICMISVGSVRADGTVISISPSSDTIPQSQIGTDFVVNISISTVTNLWSWAANLNWNPSVLNFTKISEGPFLKNAGNTFFAPTFPQSGSLPDISDTVYPTNRSFSGSGVLATVIFKILAAGQSDITLSHTNLWLPLSGNYQGHPTIAHSVNNGQLIVLGNEHGPEFPTWVVLTIISIVFTAAIIAAAILIMKRLKPRRQYYRYKTREGPKSTS